MKISDAINILNIKNYDITNIQHISYNELKKHNHIQSLIYHPDKNTDDGAKEEPSEEDEIVLSKHKMEGKHSLKYDSIFKGKKEDPLDESDPEGFSLYYKESI